MSGFPSPGPGFLESLSTSASDLLERLVSGMIYDVLMGTVNQWLKWFCEAGASPDEARLEQTPYPLQPH